MGPGVAVGVGDGDGVAEGSGVNVAVGVFACGSSVPAQPQRDAASTSARTRAQTFFTYFSMRNIPLREKEWYNTSVIPFRADPLSVFTYFNPFFLAAQEPGGDGDQI